MLKASEDVFREMEDWMDLTRVIIDSMKEMLAFDIQISNAVHEVADITHRHSTESSVQEVNKFKI